MISCEANENTGTMQISGITPNGIAVITRDVDGQVPYLLRGGAQTIGANGFVLTDTEAPLGVPLAYTATITNISTADRTVQQNLMLTPTFMRGVQGWTAGTGRTMWVAADTTAHSTSIGHVTGTAGGVAPTTPPTMVGHVDSTVFEAGSYTLTPPTGGGTPIATNDWMIIIHQQLSSYVAPPTPSGWTLVSDITNASIRQVIWKRKRVGGDSGYTVAAPSGSASIGSLVYVRGAMDEVLASLAAYPAAGTGVGTPAPAPAVPNANTYTASTAIIPNPDRGFFQYTETHYATTTITTAFTGTNGAAWPSPWTQSSSRTGSSATIQSNRGQLDAGTLTGYTGKHSMKLNTNYTDAEISGTFSYGNTVDGAMAVWLRADATIDGANGYSLHLNKSGTVTVEKSVAYAGTQLGTTAFTLANAVPNQVSIAGLTFQLTGTNIARGAGELVQFTVYPANPATNQFGVEVAVAKSNGAVLRVNNRLASGSTVQTVFDPSTEYLLSGHGNSVGQGGTWLSTNATVGAIVSLTVASSGGGGGSGDKKLGVYKNFFEPVPDMRDWPSDVKGLVNVVYAAIAQSGGSGTGILNFSTSGTGQTPAQVKADVEEYISRGCQVLLAIGGASDGGITITTDAQADQAFTSISNYRTQYSFNGLDIDLEPSGSTWTQAALVRLITSCKTTFGSSFSVGITPGLYGVHTAKWMALYNAAPTLIDYVQPMLYDFPEAMDSRLNGVAIDKCNIMANAGIPNSKMRLGFMMQPPGTTNYPASPNSTVVINAYNAVLALRPDLGGAFFWVDEDLAGRNWDGVRDLGPIVRGAAAPTTPPPEYKFRFSAIGTAIKAKVWAAAAVEPGTYQIDVTDGAITAAGAVALEIRGGSAVNMQARVDDVLVTSGTGSGHVALNSATLTTSRTTDSRSVVFRLFVLEAFLATDTITPAYLALVAADLAAIKAAGCKAVIRFAYSTSGDIVAPYGADPPVARVLTHIAQLAPTLNAASDVLWAVQMGFIGMWGQQYYTDNFGDLAAPNAQNWIDRELVLDKLLLELDTSIYVLVRYPGLKHHRFGDPATLPAAARVGFHNDSFLAAAEDDGTYTRFSSLSAAATRAYMAAETTATPMGGESSAVNGSHTLWPDAAIDLAAFRWQFLSPITNAAVITSWGANTDIAARNLGYRLRLVSSSLPGGTVTGDVALSFQVANDGYAAPVSPSARRVQVIFTSGGTVVVRTLAADARAWIPGTTTIVTETVASPGVGTWTVHLRLPDPDNALLGIPAYAIQLANTGTWDAVNGWNTLGSTVTVGTAVTPPPTGGGGGGSTITTKTLTSMRPRLALHIASGATVVPAVAPGAGSVSGGATWQYTRNSGTAERTLTAASYTSTDAGDTLPITFTYAEALAAGMGITVAFQAPGTLLDRVIAKGKASALTASTTYLMTGRFKFLSGGLNTWQTVKDFGTWQDVKDANASWLAVRGVSSTVPGDYTKLFVTIVNPADQTDYINPVQVIAPGEVSVNTWIDFSFFFTTTAVIPTTAEVRLSHGTRLLEYSILWDLDEFGITPQAQRLAHDTLYWFDGDTPRPAKPVDNLLPDRAWEATTTDSSISWAGTASNSISTYLGPSGVTTSTTCQLDAVSTETCEPVLLSDPVNASLAAWAGLVSITGLTHPAHQSIYRVISRPDPVAVSQVRGWETGELTLLTGSLAARDQLMVVLRSGRVLLLRNGQAGYPETDWYLSIGDVGEQRLTPDHRNPTRLWTLPFTRVARPTGMIEASSGVTWQQVKDMGTWDYLRTNRSDWLDVILTTPGA